jgi:hypothetical protein
MLAARAMDLARCRKSSSATSSASSIQASTCSVRAGRAGQRVLLADDRPDPPGRGQRGGGPLPEGSGSR